MSMKKIDMISDLIEELVYENGMEWLWNYEKVDIDEERVEVYKVMEVFCICFFDYGDSLGELVVVDKFDDIKKVILEE